MVFLSVLFCFSISLLSAEVSIHDIMSDFPEDRREAFFSGETIELGSPDGDDVSSIAFDGTKGKDKAVSDSKKSGSFTMGIAAFVPYPEEWEKLSHDERKLEIINTLLSISTLEGTTYISHAAGEQPKELFSESYTLTAAKKGKKASDAYFTYAPEEYSYEIAAYLKDNIFGGNTYVINYDIMSDEIFVTFTNCSKLKFLFYTAVEKEELNMSVDVLMTKEGLALFALATVGREETTIDTPFVSVHLPSAFTKRIVALKNWFTEEID